MRPPRPLAVICAILAGVIVPRMCTLGQQESKRREEISKLGVLGELDRSPDSDAFRERKGERERIFSEHNGTGTGENREQGITASNKASSLIGMEVRNQQNERLGDIKDVVMDLPSGRISYVVLSSGGFLGIGDRLIAVPPWTIQIAAEGDHLVINADKQKIRDAPSFARTNWPDPGSANFDAYWTSDREAVGGVSAGVAVGSGSGRSERNESSAETERQSRAGIRYQGERNSVSTDPHLFKGRITSINPEARTMTVEGEHDSRTFIFSDRPTLTIKSNRNPHLIDLKVGYHVAVGYHEGGDGKQVAHSVSATAPAEIK